MPRKASKGAITFQKFLQKIKQHLSIDTSCLEEGLFYIYRTDTHQVLARGIEGFDAAKQRANALRKHYGLTWEQVRFKKEAKPTPGASGGPNSRSPSAPVRMTAAVGITHRNVGTFGGTTVPMVRITTLTDDTICFFASVELLWGLRNALVL